MPLQTIEDVIAELNTIVDYCVQHRHRAGFFAALYKRMTVAVSEGIAAGIFEDGKRMEQLDICFAQRYLDAWHFYGLKQPCTASWQFTFDGCFHQPNTVLQHLLLGINTHINLDLAIAAAQVAPGSAIDALEEDFNRINNVIATLMDDVQESLSKVWFPMRFITKIANRRHEPVLNFSIETARKVSWANAVVLAHQDDNGRREQINLMDNTVKQIGQRIQQPGRWAGFLLWLVRKTEYDDVARTIKLIDTTIVP